MNTKFLPVLPDGGSQVDIPDALQGSNYYSPGDQAWYLRLYRRITGQPAVVARSLGSPLVLPPETVDLPPLPDKDMAEQAAAYLQRLHEETGEIRRATRVRASPPSFDAPLSTYVTRT